MVYSDTGPRRFLTILLVLIGLAMAGFLIWGDQIQDRLSFLDLRGQVTPVQQSLMDYLKIQPGAVGALDLNAIANNEDIQQQFLQTLLTHQNEFDTSSVTAAQSYLRDYYGFLEPVPAELTQIIQASAQQFLQALTLIGSSSGTISPFVNDILTIIANHRVATNNYQAVQRSQSTRLLLERLIEEL